MNDNVILVDENDKQIGIMPKLEAHEKGLLHRAFSIFIFNSKGEMLIQQRASEKYHSPNLWSNTCCSHPQPGESVMDATTRRLMDEMGMRCTLEPIFNFIYKAPFFNGLTEHEYDHVFFGVSESIPKINKNEVKDWKYIDISTLKQEISKHPENYTIWLRYCLDNVIEYRAKRIK